MKYIIIYSNNYFFLLNIICILFFCFIKLKILIFFFLLLLKRKKIQFSYMGDTKRLGKKKINLNDFNNFKVTGMPDGIKTVY